MVRGAGIAGFLLAGFVGASISALAQADAVTLRPAVVEAGSPVLIRVDAPATATIDGEWMGRRIEFFHGQGWLALAGVDVASALGPSKLKITVKANGVAQDLSRTVEIHEAHYKTESLTVAEGFVEPKENALARIKAESELKARVFGASAQERLWDGDFRVPVVSTPTDSFGERRMFNGKLASIHQGMDFRARNTVGTFLYHCHLLEHEDGGMMGRIRVERERTSRQRAHAPLAATQTPSKRSR